MDDEFQGTHPCTPGHPGNLPDFGVLEPRISRIEQILSRIHQEITRDKEQRNERDEMIIEILRCFALQASDGNSRKATRYDDAYVASQVSTVTKILTPEIVQKGAANVIARYIYNKMRKRSFTKETLLDVFRILLFAPHANERNVQLMTEIGQLFHGMKHFILNNYVTNCCSFSRRREIEEREDTSTRDPKEMAFVAPMWTRSGCISKEQIREVSDSYNPKTKRTVQLSGSNNSTYDISEASTNGRATKRKRVCEDLDAGKNEKMSIAVLQAIWGAIGQSMNQSRHRSRVVFTSEIGFLTEMKANAEWAYRIPLRYYEEFDKLPDARTVTKDISEMKCDTDNEALLESMAGMFPKLEMKVQYDVSVFATEKELAEKWRTGEKRRITTVINFFDIACKYLTDFFHFRTTREFIRTSKDGLRMIFMITMGFGEVIDRMDAMREKGDPMNEIISFLIQMGLLIDGRATRFK